MKADIFIHYYNRVKLKFRGILKTTAKLYKTAKLEIKSFASVTSFYYKEISILFRVFRYNRRDIYRFKKQRNNEY